MTGRGRDFQNIRKKEINKKEVRPIVQKIVPRRVSSGFHPKKTDEIARRVHVLLRRRAGQFRCFSGPLRSHLTRVPIFYPNGLTVSWPIPVNTLTPEGEAHEQANTY